MHCSRLHSGEKMQSFCILSSPPTQPNKHVKKIVVLHEVTWQISSHTIRYSYEEEKKCKMHHPPILFAVFFWRALHDATVLDKDAKCICIMIWMWLGSALWSLTCSSTYNVSSSQASAGPPKRTIIHTSSCKYYILNVCIYFDNSFTRR
jgi:hypothetical protein